MTSADPEADWSEELLRSGRVEVRTSRRRLGLVLLIVIGFTLAGIWLVSMPTGIRAEIAGWASIAFFGVLGIPAIAIQLARGGTTVVVTREHIDLGRGVTVPWSDVAGVGVVRIRSTRLVAVRLKDLAAQQRALAGNRLAGRLASMSNSITGGTDLTLPSPLAADPEALVRWLAGFVPDPDPAR